MNIEELYGELKKAYSAENLNALSSNIITLYRNRDISTLRKIHAMMFNGNQAAEERNSRIFTRIITHYHPDRQEQIRRDLEGLRLANDLEGMKKYEHILDVQHMNLHGSSLDPVTADDFDLGDIWDYSAGGYSYINDEEQETDEYDPYMDMIIDHGFFSAVKRKIYGHLNVDFPAQLLADLEFVEMAEYEIENLDGIEYCTYARILDLSGNNLTEVTQLAQLLRLEEVFLQNNHISYIDGLNELPYLRILDLSHNDVDDLSPLFEVDSLEFLNIMGNRVPAWQLEKLQLMGVVVVA